MKYLKASFLVLALLACGQAVALPADHPANPEMAVPAFQPADYFAGQPGNVKLAADEHQHDAAPAAQESGAKDEPAAKQHGEGEGKGCKRESKGCCCCCKCCDKGNADKDGMGCMKKSGGEHMHEGKEGCGMMKKDMDMGGKSEEKAGVSDEHEGHH